MYDDADQYTRHWFAQQATTFGARAFQPYSHLDQGQMAALSLSPIGGADGVAEIWDRHPSLIVAPDLAGMRLPRIYFVSGCWLLSFQTPPLRYDFR